MKIVKSVSSVLILTMLVTGSVLGGGKGKEQVYPPRPAAFPASVQMPFAQNFDIEAGTVVSEENNGFFKRLKDACVGGIKNSWGKLSRVAKDATEVAVLAGINGGAMAYKSFVRDDQVPVLTSYATGQTAADLTERINYYWKVLASVLAIGGCEVTNYLTGADLSVFENSAIVYAIHGSFEQYAIATGRKNTFSEDFRNLPTNLQQEITKRIGQLAEQVQAIRDQRAQVSDIEMGIIAEQESPGCFKRFKDSCSRGVKQCWGKLPRGVKDTIELVGLAGVDGASLFYKYYYGNRYLSLLTSYAIGKTAADITERQKYYWKLLTGAAIITGCELIKFYSGADLWTFSTSAIMYLIHSSLEEYAVMTGRKNKFTEDFRGLPTDLQELIIGRIKKLAEQVRLVKSGKANIQSGTNYIDVEMGLVTPVRPAIAAQPVPLMASPVSTASSPNGASSSGSPAQTEWSKSSSSPERVIESEEFDIENLGELRKLDEVARRLDEQLRLLPTVEAKQNLVKQWWNKLGRGKRDACELFGIASVGTLIDGLGHAIRSFSYSSWWVSVFFAYASGRTAAKITSRQKYYLKVIGGIASWIGAWQFMEATKFNWATMGISSLMFIVHSSFEEYARLSGRSNDYERDFRQLPNQLQEAMVNGLTTGAPVVRLAPEL